MIRSLVITHVFLVACGGCAVGDAGGEGAAATAATASTTVELGPPPNVAPPLPTGRLPQRTTATASAVDKSAVCAPSLSHRGRFDARTSDALDRCEKLNKAVAHVVKSCGLGERNAKDMARFAASVPAIEGPVRDRVQRVFKRGRELGRNPRAFGLVGDSITVSTDFLSAFGKNSVRKVEMSDWVKDQISLSTGETVVDWFRGGVAETSAGVEHDPFTCYRAAKVGARASWACEIEESRTPIAELVARVNPAYAVLTFGANDAAYRAASPESVADEFEKNLTNGVRLLEEAGVVVIVSNEMRHGDQPGVKACPKDAPQNDWHVAVNTNATSARAAELACREGLPFIDLRHALDAATNFGLGKDGVHLTTFQRGAGILDEQGLDCGNNIRNLVTLIALARVVDATSRP